MTITEHLNKAYWSYKTLHGKAPQMMVLSKNNYELYEESLDSNIKYALNIEPPYNGLAFKASKVTWSQEVDELTIKVYRITKGN